VAINKFQTTQWEPVTGLGEIGNKEHRSALAIGSSFKKRHILALLAFFLIVASPVIGFATGMWTLAAMAASLALVMFFFFALLIPSDVYHLDG
jgi:hypothetical protein